MRKKHKVTIEELRRKFPLGATIFYKGQPFATVCGYNRFINGSYDNEPEVMYLSWKIDKTRYPDRAIGQFTVRSPHYSVKPYELDVYDKNSYSLTGRYRVITVYFNPKDYFEYQGVWFDETNKRWAIDSKNLHKYVR